MVGRIEHSHGGRLGIAFEDPFSTVSMKNFRVVGGSPTRSYALSLLVHSKFWNSNIRNCERRESSLLNRFWKPGWVPATLFLPSPAQEVLNGEVEMYGRHPIFPENYDEARVRFLSRMRNPRIPTDWTKMPGRLRNVSTLQFLITLTFSDGTPPSQDRDGALLRTGRRIRALCDIK